MESDIQRDMFWYYRQTPVFNTGDMRSQRRKYSTAQENILDMGCPFYTFRFITLDYMV